MTQTHHHHKKEHWLNSKWRPMMAWSYFVICLFDFLIAPILWSLAQATFHGSIQTQWQPITLLGGGLYHISMGVVLGISAYGRTQEKLGGVANNNMMPMPPMVSTTMSGSDSAYIPPSSVMMNSSGPSSQATSGTITPINSTISTVPPMKYSSSAASFTNNTSTVNTFSSNSASPIVSDANGKLCPPQVVGPEL